MFKKLVPFVVAMQLASCASATNRIPTVTTPSQLNGDAGQVVPVDVRLQGLPERYEIVAPPTDGGMVLSLGANNGEVVVALLQDARAPFNGVLFNGPAIARVVVEFQGQQQLCLLDRRHDVELVVARYNADMASLQLAMDTQRRTDQVLLTGRDADLTRLNRLLDQQRAAATGPHIGEGLIWAGGGLLLGALLIGGIVVFANSRP